MDAIDRRIVAALQRDGRQTNAELAQAVGLSPSPCLRRVRALERAGVIRGYTALVDEAKMGFGMSAFVSVRLAMQVDDALARFERAILRFPEVIDCWLMTGSRDYLLRVAARDLADYERFLVGSLTKVEGVASIESSIPLRRIKSAVSRGA